MVCNFHGPGDDDSKTNHNITHKTISSQTTTQLQGKLSLYRMIISFVSLKSKLHLTFFLNNY